MSIVLGPRFIPKIATWIKLLLLLYESCRQLLQKTPSSMTIPLSNRLVFFATTLPWEEQKNSHAIKFGQHSCHVRPKSLLRTLSKVHLKLASCMDLSLSTYLQCVSKSNNLLVLFNHESIAYMWHKWFWSHHIQLIVWSHHHVTPR
jgi:hypothetical protein